ncbi:MAG TPA: PAS domain S-box protein [Anaerolineaceae bacterium]
MNEPKLNVLLIEDSISDAALITYLLTSSRKDCHVLRVDTAQGMIEALTAKEWDVIISDYMQPEFSAPEALKILQQSGKDIPFIVVTGAVGEDTAVAMMKAGAHDYIMKDNLSRLVPSVEREIRDAQTRKERRQMERELAEERYLLQTLLKNIPDRIYFKDLQSRFTRISKSQMDLFGITDVSEVYGKDDFDYFTPEHAQPAYDTEQQIIMSGEPVIDLEEKETLPDGRVNWVSTTKMPLRDADGKIVGTFGISRDITRRKKAEQDLFESQQFIQATLDAIPDHICVLDENGVILAVNQAWKKFADENPPAPINYCLGMNYLEICEKAPGIDIFSEAIPFAAGIKAVMNDEVREFALDYPCNHPSGENRWFTARVTRFQWEGPLRLVISHINITKQKKNEESLILQSAALEAAANAIVITDHKGDIQWVNNAFQKLTGYVLDEVRGRNPRILKSGKQDQGVYKKLWETIQSGKVWYGELINRRKDGSFYAEEMSITPLQSASGTIDHYIAIKQDITQRKAIEQALIEEKERYQSLYENIPVGLYRTTPDGKILMANPALVRLLGYSSLQDLQSRNLEEGGYEQKLSRDYFKKEIIRQGSIRDWQVNLKKADGSIITVRENAKGIFDGYGNLLYYEGTIEDITDIRQVETQNLRLVAAIEQAAEVVIVTDPMGTILYLNPAFGVTFGISASEILGKNINILSNAYQDIKEWQNILAVPQGGKVWRGDFRVIDANGKYIELNATISPILGFEQEVSSLVFVMRDVTHERELDKQHRQSQKLEAIGQLAAGIAHEINTPTQFIGNNLQFLKAAFKDIYPLLEQFLLIRQEPGVGFSAAQTQDCLIALSQEIDLNFLMDEIPAALDGALNGVDRVSKIVNAMKEFSHPGIHEKVLADINHAIENTITVSRNEWKYEADIITKLSPDLPLIPCLVDEFNQVILNLIKNSVDAIREKGVDSQSETSGLITIETFQDGDSVVVRVGDNGPGIPVAIQDRIFDPFFTTKEVGKGTGQGLAISYDVIVNKLGGKIGFETEIGKGTTFVIRLPIQTNKTGD